MKVLTLTQPWATLVAIGAKKIETRSWRTAYRGPLGIHAAAGLGPVGGERGFKKLCGTEPFCSVLNAAGKRWLEERGGLADMVAHPLMPFGAIVAVCKLIDCVDTQYVRNVKIVRRNRDRLSEYEWLWTANEIAFGDYSPGRYAWLLADIRTLPEPVPARGALGLWKLDTLTEMAVIRTLIGELSP